MMQPLSGIRVIGMEQYIAGPYCTMLLADAGAEVIKIERPGTGDHRRAIPPFVEKEGVKKGVGFISYNRNKKSVVLDLQKPQGQEIYKALAAQSDVILENMRPGAMDKLDLGYEALKAINPRLVYATISGFGRLPEFAGPYSHLPGFDIVAEAMSGVMHAVGFEDKPPSWTIYGLADLYSGMVTAYGIMQALFMRERTGEGQYVDSAMYDNMVSLNERMVALYSTVGQSVRRGRLEHLYPRGAFKTKDGYIAINIPDDLMWGRLCKAMEREDLIDDPRSDSGTTRAANSQFLKEILEGWLADFTRREAVERINAAGIPAGPVHTAEDIFADPQLEARQMLMRIDDPDVGPYQFARSPLHLSAAPTLPTEPAPNLGQHTAAVIQEVLGYDSSQIGQLAAAGVIQIG